MADLRFELVTPEKICSSALTMSTFMVGAAIDFLRAT